MKGDRVYVVDGWDDTDEKAIVEVFGNPEEADSRLSRLQNAAAESGHDLYIGVVSRKVK